MYKNAYEYVRVRTMHEFSLHILYVNAEFKKTCCLLFHNYQEMWSCALTILITNYPKTILHKHP